MQDYFLPALIIGFSSGLAPGPLMTLVISQTLRHGFWDGVKVAVAPFITDLPIIAAIIFTLSFFSDINLFLAIISFLGAAFVLYLSYESFKIKGFKIDTKSAKTQSIRKGILTNLLNPAPYLFYFTVGGAIILKSLKTDLVYTFVFIFTFLACLVITKIVLAFVVERSRNFFSSKVYLILNKALAIALFIFAIKLLFEGLSFI